MHMSAAPLCPFLGYNAMSGSEVLPILMLLVLCSLHSMPMCGDGTDDRALSIARMCSVRGHNIVLRETSAEIGQHIRQCEETAEGLAWVAVMLCDQIGVITSVRFSRSHENGQRSVASPEATNGMLRSI